MLALSFENPFSPIVIPFSVQDLKTLNDDLINGVLQPGRFIRLPPWSSSCPDPDSDAQSCRVYTGKAGSDGMLGSMLAEMRPAPAPHIPPGRCLSTCAAPQSKLATSCLASPPSFASPWLTCWP